MTRIQLWNGDICDLEVDAIVTAANPSLWMATGVASAIKQAGGDEIEFAAVRQAPVSLGDAIVTPAGRLAARLVIHAVSIDRDRRTSAAAIEAALRNAFQRARENDVSTLAIPALGTGVGGFPIEEAARISVATVRDELRRSPGVRSVTFALRAGAAYAAFQAALAEPVAVEIQPEAPLAIDIRPDDAATTESVPGAPVAVEIRPDGGVAAEAGRASTGRRTGKKKVARR